VSRVFIGVCSRRVGGIGWVFLERSRGLRLGSSVGEGQNRYCKLLLAHFFLEMCFHSPIVITY
jgi:hypothetical protein